MHYSEARFSHIFQELFSSEQSLNLIFSRRESIKELIFELIEDMDWMELSACKWSHPGDFA